MKADYLHSFAGELLGTFVLVFIGCATVAVTVLFSAHTGLFQVAAVWGAGVTLAIYATRHLSCAHLNPAVSVAMVLSGRMAPRKLPVYLAAQLAGAFLAGLCLYLVFSGSIAAFENMHHIVRGTSDSVKTAMMFGEYFPNPSLPAGFSVTMTTAFGVEAAGTFLLVLMIFLLTEGCNVGRPSSEFAPVLIGLTVTTLISIFAPLTQAGLNPARDFGPRLAAYLAGWGKTAIPGPHGGFFTVYILGPLVGGCLAALLFGKVLEPLMAAKSSQCGCADIKKDPAEVSPVAEKTVKVLVFGTTPPCARCRQAETEARQAANEFPAGQVTVEKLDALSPPGRQYGVAVTPAILVNGRQVAAGRVLKRMELAEIIRRELEA
ncbi:aquaporin [Desulfotomaculum copahuensis]|uniref:Thioredoxin-like fold domain-containing protein n=1 Tax=Desulfotomaculum copahuensis TaxID=1838280 RepID=A0A1B7LI87_9FIRM|nr:aquaporin [Desulfotomaculum copahuensis]OAT86134.1 hypothetical protein A6M21_04270 [Desulfotomaculum copahuensis]